MTEAEFKAKWGIGCHVYDRYYAALDGPAPMAFYGPYKPDADSAIAALDKELSLWFLPKEAQP